MLRGQQESAGERLIGSFMPPPPPPLSYGRPAAIAEKRQIKVAFKRHLLSSLASLNPCQTKAWTGPLIQHQGSRAWSLCQEPTMPALPDLHLIGEHLIDWGCLRIHTHKDSLADHLLPPKPEVSTACVPRPNECDLCRWTVRMTKQVFE